MTAKEYLEQYKEADRLARRLAAEYERERELIDAVRSTADLEGLPHGNGIKNPVEDRVIRLVDKAAEFKMAEIDALHLKQEVFETIQKVKGIEAEVLTLRYINLMPWERIADEINYSVPGTYNIHSRGLSAVEEIINGQ